MTIANELIKTLSATSKQSARAQQESVGPSEIGGCRRKVWYRINGQEKVNPNTLSLASVMGTAIHSYIQEAFQKADPTGFLYELEVEVNHDGLRGHVDMYDRMNHEIVDWKTTKIRNLSYFPSKQQRWQVQLYGYLMDKNGYTVENVTLVAIPRDGDERDIVYHSEPYNPEIALEAIAWLREVESMTEAPAPEKDASFCRLYCSYYDESGLVGCVGRGKDLAEGAVIEDTQIANSAKKYLEIVERINELENEKDGIKATLEGVNGVTPEGIKVSWSITAGRKTVDEQEVEKLLGFVPKKIGKESTRLIVKG